MSRLCKALNVNHSTYYNSLNHKPSKRDIENQKIRSHLLELYIKYNKRLGAIKLNRRLFVEYGISISLGRVYRLLKSMPLPRMSTVKPSFKASKNNNDEDENLNKGISLKFSGNKIDDLYISLINKEESYKLPDNHLSGLLIKTAIDFFMLMNFEVTIHYTIL